jgi:hypothetical protein
MVSLGPSPAAWFFSPFLPRDSSWNEYIQIQHHSGHAQGHERRSSFQPRVLFWRTHLRVIQRVEHVMVDTS